MIGPEPAGRMVDAGGVAFHVITLGDTGPPTVFLHGGGPGCTAWTDFGAVAPLFAADRVGYLVDLRAMAGSGWNASSMRGGMPTGGVPNTATPLRSSMMVRASSAM